MGKLPSPLVATGTCPSCACRAAWNRRLERRLHLDLRTGEAEETIRRLTALSVRECDVW